MTKININEKWPCALGDIEMPQIYTRHPPDHAVLLTNQSRAPRRERQSDSEANSNAWQRFVSYPIRKKPIVPASTPLLFSWTAIGIMLPQRWTNKCNINTTIFVMKRNIHREQMMPAMNYRSNDAPSIATVGFPSNIFWQQSTENLFFSNRRHNACLQTKPCVQSLNCEEYYPEGWLHNAWTPSFRTNAADSTERY